MRRLRPLVAACSLLALLVGSPGGLGKGLVAHAAQPAVVVGDSKTACIYPDWSDRYYSASQVGATVRAVTAATGVAYECVMAFATGELTWAAWERPWPTDDGFGAWVEAKPGRQLVLGVNLVPKSAPGADASGEPSEADPIEWETACDGGAYDGYARSFAEHLVAAQLGGTVIRLGVEANGGWETDYLGDNAAEGAAWAGCFDREVAAMRSVAGGDFLFVWGPSACTPDDPFSTWYPGNAYVDIIGIDQYDSFCASDSPTAPSAAAFTALAAEPDGLDAIAAFAEQHGKPLALPEWGNVADVAGGGLGDDPYYVEGIANWVARHDVAFETYFDSGSGNVLTLTPDNPATLSAYSRAFRYISRLSSASGGDPAAQTRQPAARTTASGSS